MLSLRADSSTGRRVADLAGNPPGANQGLFGYRESSMIIRSEQKARGDGREAVGRVSIAGRARPHSNAVD